MKTVMRGVFIVGVSFLFAISASSIGAADPIPISTIEELQAIGANETTLAGSYVLTNDINAAKTKRWNNGKGFNPIGRADPNYGFQGTFDGQGHVIRNLYINRPNEDYVGLFGYSFGSSIANVGLKKAKVIGKDNVGALVAATVYSGTQTSCWSSGIVVGASLVGGLVGGNYYGVGSISSSYSSATVIGTDSVGGLAGIIFESSISDCYSTGTVSGGQAVGGLVGVLGDYSHISNSYSVSPVQGTDSVGGLAGKSFELASPSGISDSFCTGPVQGSNYIGGMIGYNSITWIHSSYCAGTVTGTGSDIGGFAGKTVYDYNTILLRLLLEYEQFGPEQCRRWHP